MAIESPIPEIKGEIDGDHDEVDEIEKGHVIEPLGGEQLGGDPQDVADDYDD